MKYTRRRSMQDDDTRQSKALSWLLRHGAPEVGIPMDPAGWVGVDAVLAHLRLDRARLRHLVETNGKRRLEIAGDRVRCSQGHSRAMPVTLDALEASWTPVEGDALIWHGTTLDAVDSIDREGLSAVRRTHVHLAASVDSSVGIRSMIHVALAVSPSRLRAQGLGIFAASNGVILVRHVPRDCIVGAVPCTRRARKMAGALTARFGAAGAAE